MATADMRSTLSRLQGKQLREPLLALLLGLTSHAAADTWVGAHRWVQQVKSDVGLCSAPGTAANTRADPLTACASPVRCSPWACANQFEIVPADQMPIVTPALHQAPASGALGQRHDCCNTKDAI